MQGTFRISRGARTEVQTVMVEIAEAGATGRGECVPYPRYDETVESVVGQIESVAARVEQGLTVVDLQALDRKSVV